MVGFKERRTHTKGNAIEVPDHLPSSALKFDSKCHYYESHGQRDSKSYWPGCCPVTLALLFTGGPYSAPRHISSFGTAFFLCTDRTTVH